MPAFFYGVYFTAWLPPAPPPRLEHILDRSTAAMGSSQAAMHYDFDRRAVPRAAVRRPLATMPCILASIYLCASDAPDSLTDVAHSTPRQRRVTPRLAPVPPLLVPSARTRAAGVLSAPVATTSS